MLQIDQCGLPILMRDMQERTLTEEFNIMRTLLEFTCDLSQTIVIRTVT